jgi:hypothetical protein
VFGSLVRSEFLGCLECALTGLARLAVNICACERLALLVYELDVPLQGVMLAKGLVTSRVASARPFFAALMGRLMSS